MNWQERTELLFGKEEVQRLNNKSVLVIGVGGVGAYATEMMCRAGVGKITIVDADIVNPSNINRQLVALHSTIGEKKVDILSKRLLDINPDLKLTTHCMFIHDEVTEQLLDSDKFDYVIDAIDTLSPKVHLILGAKRRKIKIISSMGAGAKSDPYQISIGAIAKAKE